MENSVQGGATTFTGVTDAPLSWGSGNEDLLDLTNYLEGLKKFITTCSTPISIAIQGDWGTGKTSIMNYLKRELDKDSRVRVKTVFFNTWQYSQFDMSQSIYFSLLATLIREIKPKSPSEGCKALLKQLGNNALLAIKGIASTVTGMSENRIDEISSKLFMDQDEIVQDISRFRDYFAGFVKESLKDCDNENNEKRLVVFIDDLDRLEPTVAVELLEAMKLFMDAERCVFVLAIDYDVVVQGVREKYNGDISLSKCRSFFDKIIQVPFRMPVERYNLSGLAEKYLAGLVDKKHYKTLTDFAECTIGKNPRSFKRTLNSYLLLRSIYDADEELKGGSNKAALFCCPCIQTCSEEAHTLLLQDDSWSKDGELRLCGETLSKEELERQLRKIYPQKDRIDDDILSKVMTILQALPGTAKALYGDEKTGMQSLRGLLQKSSVTAVGSAAPRRAPATPVNRICLEGEQQEVKNATEAIAKTYQHFLKKNEGQLDALLPELRKKIKVVDDKKREDEVFRNPKEIQLTDHKVLIEASTNFAAKVQQADTLSKVLELGKDSICWYDGDELMYSNADDSSNGSK
mgnify:CR=1 FL=1